MELSSEIAFNRAPGLQLADLVNLLSLCAAADAFGAQIEGLDLTSSDPTRFDVTNSFLKRIGMGSDGFDGIKTWVGSTLWRPKQTTDDTDQLYFTAKAFLKGLSDHLGREELKKATVDEFLNWSNSNPPFGPMGIGGATLMARNAYNIRGTRLIGPWLHDELLDLGTYDMPGDGFNYRLSYAPSNSAIPRAIGVAAAFAYSGSPGGLNRLDDLAEDVTRLTHGFKDCIDVSKFSAGLIYLLLSGQDHQSAMEYLDKRYDRILTKSLGELEKDFSWGGSALTNLAVSSRAFLESPDDPWGTILNSTNVQFQKWSKIKRWGYGYSGPDTDSYAVLAAAFCAGRAVGSGDSETIRKVIQEQADGLNPYTPENFRLLGELAARR